MTVPPSRPWPAPAAAPEPSAPPTEFQAEIERDTRYERGLAVKALVALALVAVLIVMRLLGG
jgi:hypothetical protein